VVSRSERLRQLVALPCELRDAAYSSNPTTLEQIKSTDGVSELTALESGDEIWVKY
jgi:hypothetical protein